MATLPNEQEAERLLLWASSLNEGAWVAHSRVVARAAKRIADACGLDSARAHTLGLLHDIGRYEGVRGLHHTLAGYRLMTDKGFADAARICLTHSFPIKRIEAYSGARDCTADEMRFLGDFLRRAVYDDYDHLIQLCDALALAQGVATLDERLLDVTARHGFNDATLAKWEAFRALKRDFDRRCGGSVYALFRDEISARLFGSALASDGTPLYNRENDKEDARC